MIFEIFIDPDGDTHSYYELEVNAFGTPWDLLLLKPYRDGGPAVTGWDIAGLQLVPILTGQSIIRLILTKAGRFEYKIPLSALKECSKGGKMPKAGDQWRIDFFEGGMAYCH